MTLTFAVYALGITITIFGSITATLLWRMDVKLATITHSYEESKTVLDDAFRHACSPLRTEPDEERPA
jgi:hypothetical protein